MKKQIFIFLLFSCFCFNVLAQEEATTNEVENRNGFVYLYDKPFTGTLYEDSPQANNDCRCTLEANYTNGILNGKKTEYHSNGKIKFTGEYILGKEEGEHISFDSNGNILTKDKYLNGQKLNPIDEQTVVESSKPKPTRFEILEKAANEGNAQSQYDLANLYFSGKEVTKDDNKAFYWYKKSAENGFVNAQEELAAIYFQNKDFNNAFTWYSKAANSNHPRAQFVLGFMYLNGVGVEKSRRNAKSWFKKSCTLGYKDSCEEIKKMNAFGNAILETVNESIQNYNPK